MTGMIKITDYRVTPGTELWHRTRDADIAAVDKLNNADWRAFWHMYYRRMNDGDRPHHAKLKRLGRLVGIECRGRMWSDAELEAVGHALINKLLSTAKKEA